MKAKVKSVLQLISDLEPCQHGAVNLPCYRILKRQDVLSATNPQKCGLVDKIISCSFTETITVFYLLQLFGSRLIKPRPHGLENGRFS